MKEKMIEYLAKQIGLKNAVILTNGILSLPIDGETVQEKCPYCEKGLLIDKEGLPRPISCSHCKGTGTIPRPLTLGELPDRYRKMREERDKAIQLLTELTSKLGYAVKGFLNDALKEG